MAPQNPQPTFQAPGIAQPRKYTGLLPQSIDQLFENYQKSQLFSSQAALNQQQLSQNQQAQQAAGAQFALQNGGLSPQDVVQGLPAAMGQAPSVNTPPMAYPAQPGQQPPQEDPKISTLRGLLQMHAQSQQTAAAQAQAGLQKTQAEADTARGFADLFAKGGTGGGVVQNVLTAVRNGAMSPNQADDYLGRNPQAHLAYINEIAKQGVNVADLQNSYDKKKATANFEGGQNVQEPARLVDSINAGLPRLLDLAKAAGVSDIPLSNDIKLTAKNKFGSSAVQEYRTTLGELRSQIAQVLQAHGAPSESATHRSEEMLPNDIGYGQLKAVVQNDIPALLSARAEALKGNSVAKQQGAPKPGQVVNHPSGKFKFLGGDPANPASWKKQ